MNNPDLTQAQELAQAFKVAGIPQPETKAWRALTNAYLQDTTPKFYRPDTDELLRIMPDDVFMRGGPQQFFGEKRNGIFYFGYDVGQPSSNTDAVCFDAKDPKTALTELLKWALKEHPEAVRESIKEKKNELETKSNNNR